jgi:DNA-binding LacI/PurR family transcriptional regulator
MVTIKDVARMAQVGISTVSRVFSQHPDVSAETKDRVLKVAKQLRYRPHRTARQLVTNRTETICFVLSNRDIASPFHSKILLGAEQYARSLAHSVIFLRFNHSPGVPQEELVLPPIIWERGTVDGLILAGTNYPNFVRAVKELGIPFVLFGNNLIGRLATDDIDSVWYDNQGGGRKATEYLVSLGHKKIWFVGDLKLPWYRRCYQGYVGSINAHGLVLKVMEPRGDESLFDFGSRCAAQIAEAGNRPSAVVAGDDEIALGILSGFNASGVKVPADVSLIGFDDIDEIKYLRPPLTTIRVLKEKVGEELARVLFERLANPTARPVRHVIPAELVVRQSTASPDGGRQ